MSAPRDRGPRRVSGIEIVQGCIARGDAVYYARNALLPALEVELVLREVAREQLGVLEQAVLSLVGDGVSDPELLATLLGISSSRLGAFLKEFLQRGLVQEQGRGALQLTETGEISRAQGREVVDATRAVMLSGLSGELLPASAYKAPRFGVHDLGRGGRHRHLLVERARVPLAGLNLGAIADKRAYNLPEEAQAIVRVNPHPKPCFLECFLVIFGRPRAARGVEIWFPGAMLKDTPAELVEPYLEPFGFSHRQGEAAALRDLTAVFAKAGSQLASARLDAMGNPVVELSSASLDVLAWSCHGRSLAYYLGTPSQPALPISELQGRRSADERGGFARPAELDGHSLSLVARDGEAARIARRARQLHDAVDACYRDRRERVTHGAVIEAVASVCSLPEAQTLADQLEDRRLLAKLSKPSLR